MITLVQMVSICIIWWAARRKNTSRKQNWWVLALILPLWFTDQAYTIVVALSITGIIASLESLSASKVFAGTNSSIGQSQQLALQPW
ncbi:hypothetical protein JCM19239_1103 [Vibrio variabilis]|uniref:Uncharacterized protein n=1 Tax=Vibrio variabilis TaxID=990271 RepID=A0ABQ0JEA0_9VIBR|nr:hypothetical protein JCM19239_1103 [Vibrio variabilis]